ncbi:hypothetical protein BJV82DRAFT_710709 [Fennellomyces sp. T-0311]|nr:hypothetical protein BJV82DRAFT_710709 [Fennellomyces sp. T-0311]
MFLLKRLRRSYARFDTTLLSLILMSRFSYQQEDDSYDDGYDDGSADDDAEDDDDCSLISGHSCNANGICKYCAMCLQSSCIYSKSVSANTSLPLASAPACNTTQFGTPDIYDWYGYCLSSGNDSDGDYCATSSECYQYRRNANSSVSHIWNNLTCEPTSCLLTTDRGQPPPAPGQLPPSDDPGNPHHTEGGTGGNHHHHSSEFSLEDHSPAAIALTAVCSFVVIAGVIWLTRRWMRSRYAPSRPPFSWLAFCGSCGRKKKRVQSLASDTTVPSTAPPSFSSNPPEMQQRRIASSTATSIHSTSSRQREPLPSYYSPDPPPPKYEQAIVTQIRGLMQSNVDEDEAGHNSLPPPLWLPVYFTPNHSAYSFGRLRRHPPPHMAPSSSSAVASSSSSNPRHHDQSPMWHHNNDLSDPLQAFWYHHQQQMSQIQPTPSTSSPAAVDLSRRNSSDRSSTNDNGNNSSSSAAGLQ